MRMMMPAVLVLCLLAIPSMAGADIAPPAQPPGSNPVPGVEQTQVRMVSETVILEVQGETPRNSLGQARVSATFIMRNLGANAEQMAVRFPVGASDGRGNTPVIKEMSISVDGKTVPTRAISGEDPNNGSDPVPWIEFDVNFKPGVDVHIQASYLLEAAGELPFIWFNYIFSTGAGWKGNIGSAVLFVRFPYEVSQLNVLPNLNGAEAEMVEGHKFSANELKWVFTDFEPETGDNFSITIAAPSVWQELMKEQAWVGKNAWDGEAWGRVGKLSKMLAFSSRRRGFRAWEISNDKGAQTLYQMSLDAYENAVRLDKIDALWHAGLADLLGYYAYYAAFEGIDTRAESLRALAAMRTALSLAPKDEKVLEIANELTFYVDGGIVQEGSKFDFPWLTATPTTIPTATAVPPTETLQSVTETPAVVSASETAQPSATATPEKRFYPLCGSAILIPLLLVGLVLIRKPG
jgi:hypothetical protein